MSGERQVARTSLRRAMELPCGERGCPEGLSPSGGGLGVSPRNLYFKFPLSLEGEGVRG